MRKVDDKTKGRIQYKNCYVMAQFSFKLLRRKMSFFGIFGNFENFWNFFLNFVEKFRTVPKLWESISRTFLRTPEFSKDSFHCIWLASAIWISSLSCIDEVWKLISIQAQSLIKLTIVVYMSLFRQQTKLSYQ